jgi:hypothetical protein
MMNVLIDLVTFDQFSIVLPVRINTYRKNLLQCYNHLTAAVVVRELHPTRRTASFTEDIGLRTIDTSHTHLTLLAIHITHMLITPHTVIHPIIRLTLTCIKMRKEFTKVLIPVNAILLIFEMSTTARGKLVTNRIIFTSKFKFAEFKCTQKCTVRRLYVRHAQNYFLVMTLFKLNNS